MEPSEVQKYFTRHDGGYLFARWGRPVVPVVFGVDDATLAVFKGAIEAVAALANHEVSDMDPELGANFLIFVFEDWDELIETPDLDKLVPDLLPLVERLKAEGANRYRLFRFDEAGAIKAVFGFLQMDEALSQVPAEDLALAEAVQSFVLWAEEAFASTGPLGLAEDTVVLRPDIAQLVRAAYDPVMPDVTNDDSHALRLSARMRPSA